ncbi:21 kDa protein-like [Cynara cardunculus var. scolymus]|uniref:Pectinesterase inhibitor n=1 Tax=Cynara cardunculus var. scolymus TaxID=59895 RepID=A0A118JSB7_CYNCS|nr:21 kDa protein-like [Cynara cardunculus var. scolymus]KVH88376.1 Pectinesterase inhibitor [Cynara cardunculus var. scolymus]
MAILRLPFFLLFLAAVTSATTTSDFITSSCTTTTYPPLCVQSLSPYAKTIKHNPTQLARAALIVSLNRSELAQAYLQKLTRSNGLNPRQQSAVGDCLEEVSDSLDRVRNSIKELKNVDRVKGKGTHEEYVMHMSNVQTWVSSALTDENTCMDGFSDQDMEGRIRSSIRTHITYVARVTSNALALINHIAEKHS